MTQDATPALDKVKKSNVIVDCLSQLQSGSDILSTSSRIHLPQLEINYTIQYVKATDIQVM